MAIIDKPLKIQHQVHTTQELEGKEVDERIQKLMDFLDRYGQKYQLFEPKDYPIFDKKEAYPNFDQYAYIPKPHDLNKWVHTFHTIKQLQGQGISFREAVKQATRGWVPMETYDFLNWVKFYEEGAHMKYKVSNLQEPHKFNKTAQAWYENDKLPGYFLYSKPEKTPEPTPTVDTQALEEARLQEERKQVEKELIERQRAKIISRLDAAEKLLRSKDGQTFAGIELGRLMETLHKLKRDIQLVQKQSVATKLYDDMIIREANRLTRSGFVKAADVLYKVAQTAGMIGQTAQGAPDNTGVGAEVLPPVSPADPSGAGQGGTISGLPSTAPGTPNINTPVDGDQNKDQPSLDALTQTPGNNPQPPTGVLESTQAIIPQDTQPKGIKDFLENMNDGNLGIDELAADEPVNDNNDNIDHLEVSDADDIVVAVYDGEEDLIVEAQAIDVPAPSSPDLSMAPVPKSLSEKSLEVPLEEPLEVAEEDIKPNLADFDLKMDNAFADATIQDVIAKLEAVVQVYRTKELARQLSVVDMMLDALGMGGVFTELSESISKNLESSLYVQNRLQGILDKLKGSTDMKGIDLTGGPSVRDDAVANEIKERIERQDAKEKERKARRKQQQEMAEEKSTQQKNKETPQIEMEELAPSTPKPVPTVPPVIPTAPVI